MKKEIVKKWNLLQDSIKYIATSDEYDVVYERIIQPMINDLKDITHPINYEGVQIPSFEIEAFSRKFAVEIIEQFFSVFNKYRNSASNSQKRDRFN